MFELALLNSLLPVLCSLAVSSAALRSFAVWCVLPSPRNRRMPSLKSSAPLAVVPWWAWLAPASLRPVMASPALNVGEGLSHLYWGRKDSLSESVLTCQKHR